MEPGFLKPGNNLFFALPIKSPSGFNGAGLPEARKPLTAKERHRKKERFNGAGLPEARKPGLDPAQVAEALNASMEPGFLKPGNGIDHRRLHLLVSQLQWSRAS